jgi:DNA-binding CsgD family transcriptional regulator/PAS domain-containing protein
MGVRGKNQDPPPSPDQLPARFALLASRPEPLLVLRLPDERILLATESARALLAPDGTEVVGRTLAEFTDAPAGEAAELLVKGYLNAFQLRRVRTVEPADDLEIWVQAASEPARSEPTDAELTEPVLALLSQADQAVEWASQPPAEQVPAFGWTDRRFLLQQLNEEAEQLIGRPAGELIGQSLLGLVGPDRLAPLLFALGHLAGSGQAVSLPVTLERTDRPGSRCHLVLLASAPGYAFALQPVLGAWPRGADRSSRQRPAADRSSQERPAEEALLPLRRFGQGLAAARGARELLRPRPGLPELTSRELQIVNRLLAGDRVPAISRQLYLAQSTVRNHLSAVFAKLGVRSQQELIVLLRKALSDRIEQTQD